LGLPDDAPAKDLSRRSPFPFRVACLAALCGLLISTLPYFSWYRDAHSSVWIADADEIIYTEVASNAYYRHPLRLSDPTFVNGGQAVYSWLQLVPGELVCNALGLRPIRFGLVLRIFGGLAVGFGWYAVFWQILGRRWIALAAAILPLTDGGWVFLRPFIYQTSTLARVLWGQPANLFAGAPAMHHEWRIISPVVALPFLFLYLWALRRSVERFSWARVIGSGFAFGLLFYAYFYFWTAAGFALLLGVFVDCERWRVYFDSGWIGFVVGAPELARMLLTRRAQGSAWGQRVDIFLPISRWSEHGHFLLSAGLVVVTFFIVRRYYRQLLYLWCLCAAGFIMIHQQLITGLQIQNSHWANIFCSCILLLLTVLVIDVVQRTGECGRVAGTILVAAVVLNAAAGLYLRGLEAVRTRDSRHYSLAYEDFEKQQAQRGAPPLMAGATTAGDEDFVEFAIIMEHVTPLAAVYPVIWSPAVSDLDFDRRIALNAYLSGMSRDEFEAKERFDLDHLQNGPEMRDAAKRAARLASRLSFFDQIAADPGAAIERYHVGYVALPAGSPRPSTLGSDWSLLQDGPAWEVWVRSALKASVSEIFTLRVRTA
jgi:hypothetical protein